MPLAVSNIAWPAELETQAAARLMAAGVDGVEVAPTKVWPKPLEATRAEVARYRQFWESRGLPIVALQSLLFGQNHLQMFADESLRREMFDCLSGMIRLAQWLGAGVLVFGSPKNRLVGSGSQQTAREIAVNFFRQLGQAAHDHGVWFCIEPNPKEYGCDFITNASDGLALVRDVNQPGFGLHLDAAGMTLAGDNAHEVMRSAGSWWRHFHISEPYLQPVGAGGSDHTSLATAIAATDYRGWLSIEMKPLDASQPDQLSHVDTAVEASRRCYSRSESLPDSLQPQR